MIFTSDSNRILRALKQVRKGWPEEARENNSASLIKIYYRMQETYREAHENPEDWMTFTPEVIDQMIHAQKVLGRLISIYELEG